ncbi:MAG: prepilin-type N-terminal cleavage/methylation domain-containing protein [Ideonella sp.]|nr:prepilin-type N-terminal cleavage/methylation domain-containing protein [Ideonella sp.]MCC7457426.1 prepilin-type N-terminal cleavage/methylation domain-containing protein [Nitrospira sp.]
MLNTRCTSRGVSLVEAMVALAVMAFGMLAVVGVQSTLRLNAEVAKQRTEATRIAQETIEARRAFTTIEGSGGYNDAIVNAGPVAVDGPVTNTTYSVQSEVVTSADPPAKVLRVTVRWTDRSNAGQQVVLASAIAGAAPALSGTLAVRPGTAAVGPVRRPLGRHPSIPPLARQLGDVSAFVPPLEPRMAIVFNNITGVVTGVCNFGYDTSNDTITMTDIASCSDTIVGQFLSGYVRFQRRSGGGALTANDVEDPPGPALRLVMDLDLTSSGHPSGSFCLDDANYASTFDGTQRLAAYYCVIMSNAAARWSGITSVVPLRTHIGGSDVTWQISDSSGADRYRVCRYTTASSDAQGVPNVEHPRNYSDVSGNLTNQNFVVISSSKSCPTDVAANPASGDFINSNTLQHQPAP